MQQTSTGAAKAGGKGIARRGVTTTCKEEKVPRGLKRQDRNQQKSTEKAAKTKGKVRPKGVQSKEEIAPKSIKRADKNKRGTEVKEKKVSRANTMHTASGVEEKAKTVTRTAKMNQSGASLGLEKTTASSKKGIRDKNASTGVEAKRTGIRGAGGAQARSDPTKPKAVAKKKAGTASAFGQSTSETRAGGGVARRDKNKTSSGASKTAPRKARGGGTGMDAHKGSNNIFGGGSSAASRPAPRATPAHMQSGFTFG